jgi:hypothetical protein
MGIDIHLLPSLTWPSRANFILEKGIAVRQVSKADESSGAEEADDCARVQLDSGIQRNSVAELEK